CRIRLSSDSAASARGRHHACGTKRLAPANAHDTRSGGNVATPASVTLAPNARRLATPKGRSQSPRRAATRTTQAPTRSLRSRAGKPKNLAGRLFRIDPIVRLKQTLVEQSAHQLVQVSAQLLLRDVILGEERIKDSVVIGQFLDQRPHTGA